MDNYKYKSSELNTIALELRKFDNQPYAEEGDPETVCVGIGVLCVPDVALVFQKPSPAGDVVAGVYGLISDIPPEKIDRLIKACNYLNNHNKMKGLMDFDVTPDGSVKMECVIACSSNPDIGKTAMNILEDVRRRIDYQYDFLRKVLITDKDDKDFNSIAPTFIPYQPSIPDDLPDDMREVIEAIRADLKDMFYVIKSSDEDGEEEEDDSLDIDFFSVDIDDGFYDKEPARFWRTDSPEKDGHK